MNYFDNGLACINGHVINSSARTSPTRNSRYCSKCGGLAVIKCGECDAPIRGYFHVEEIATIDRWTPPPYCHECGKPYPWTQSRTEALVEGIDELEKLSGTDRERLKKSIPDILAETPKSELAGMRFKKAILSAGDMGAKFLTKILERVAAEAVKSHLGI